MDKIIFAILAMGAGACIAIQASANGNFARSLGEKPLFAAFFSICGTVLTASAAMIIIRPQAPDMSVLRETPWWNWIGGPLGALIVLAGATLVRELGAALFIALVVGGQLLCSLLLDHFALLGLEQQPITPGRVIGAILVVAGVLCIKNL
jgi:bacterial/archaeal transporter family-2 protein